MTSLGWAWDVLTYVALDGNQQVLGDAVDSQVVQGGNAKGVRKLRRSATDGEVVIFLAKDGPS